MIRAEESIQPDTSNEEPAGFYKLISEISQNMSLGPEYPCRSVLKGEIKNELVCGSPAIV